MLRRIAGILVGIALLLAAFQSWIDATELVLALPRWAQRGTNWLTDFDFWLLNHQIHTPLLAAAFCVLWVTIVVPDLWPLILRYWHGSAAFNRAFKEVGTAAARQDFRLGMERAYTAYCQREGRSRHNRSLIDAVDQIRFPESFPPREDQPISEYVRATTWPPESEHVVRFLQVLYSNSLDARDNPLLLEREYRAFIQARNVVSKFWDDCAREIREHRLTAHSIKRQLDSNARDIKLLAMSELVISETVPWDTGGGKTSLFMLAKDGAAMKTDRIWWRR
jgi:hypothetical protein